MKNILFTSLLVVSSISPAQADDYQALRFRQATAFFNYEMRQVHQQNHEREAELSQACRSQRTMQKYIDSARQRMARLAGTLPERTPITSEVTGVVKGPGFTVEKIIFKSAPHRYVTAHLYMPETEGKHPCCIEMCGHGLNGKGSGSESAIRLALNGIAAMVVDPLGQGERQQLIDADGKNLTRGVTTEHTLTAPAYLLTGTSLAAEEYFDNSRAIDYLATRPDIDITKIGCYGYSGGGTQASYLIALDRRIKAGCVGLFFSSRERTLETQGPSDGCQWMAYEGREHIEIADMALMNAPQPFLILDGRHDFVDHWGALRGYDELKRCYTALGYPDRVEQYYTEDGHGIPADSQEKMVAFFQKAFWGKAVTPLKDAPRWRGTDMLCTKQGHVNLAYADAHSTMQACEQIMDQLATARKAFAQQNRKAIQKKIQELIGLRDIVNDITPVSPRKTRLRDSREERWQVNATGQFPLPVIVRMPDRMTAQSRVVIHLSDRGKAALLTEADRTDETSDTDIHVYADLRGIGETADLASQNLSKYWNAEYRCAVTALHHGTTLVGQRVQDIVTLLNFCTQHDELRGRKICCEADGSSAVAVMHAAVIDQRLSQAQLTHTLKTWRTHITNPMQYDMMSVMIPSVLRYYDIPDLITLSSGRVSITD